MKDQYRTISFNLNGKDVTCTVDCRASLTDLLLNDFRPSGSAAKKSERWKACLVPAENCPISSRRLWMKPQFSADSARQASS